MLASTNGTDLQAIIEEIKAGTLDADLACVITNVENCGALEKAKKAGVPAHFIAPKKFSREEYDNRVAMALDAYGVDLIALVGYMRILSPWFVKKYEHRIINIHPSLLPDFPGMDLNVHKEVLKSGCKESGMTIHFVDESMDGGEIILRKKVRISSGETADSLKKKVQDLEKKWYPKVIQQFSKKFNSEKSE